MYEVAGNFATKRAEMVLVALLVRLNHDRATCTAPIQLGNENNKSWVQLKQVPLNTSTQASEYDRSSSRCYLLLRCKPHTATAAKTRYHSLLRRRPHKANKAEPSAIHHCDASLITFESWIVTSSCTNSPLSSACEGKFVQ
jgi:hypothetical protein